MDLSSLSTIVSSFAAGVVAALLLKGRHHLLAAGTKMSQRDMKMVLVVRSDLEMGRNKVAEECSRAAISCYKKALSEQPETVRRWERQGQAKVVLKIPGEAEMTSLAQDAQNKGLVAVVLQDFTPTRTETPAVLGIGPGPTSLVDNVAGHLKLF